MGAGPAVGHFPGDGVCSHLLVLEPCGQRKCSSGSSPVCGDFHPVPSFRFQFSRFFFSFFPPPLLCCEGQGTNQPVDGSHGYRLCAKTARQTPQDRRTSHQNLQKRAPQVWRSPSGLLIRSAQRALSLRSHTKFLPPFFLFFFRSALPTEGRLARLPLPRLSSSSCSWSLKKATERSETRCQVWYALATR